MKDFMYIGSAPSEEECEQVGSENYKELAIAECRRFIGLIRKKMGVEPDGAFLEVKAFPHDFGTYYEVVCYYDDEKPETLKYALLCEGHAPLTWDDARPLTDAEKDAISIS